MTLHRLDRNRIVDDISDALEKLPAYKKSLENAREIVEAYYHIQNLVKYIAEWEEQNGTSCAMLPHEYDEFMEGYMRIMRTDSCRAAHYMIKNLKE